MGDKLAAQNRWPKVAGLLLLVLLSLAGDLIAAWMALDVPGPILGLGVYLAMLVAWPAFGAATLPAARLLTRYLGALIVPAAVGLATFAPYVASKVAPLAFVLVVSTVVTGVTTALLYAGLRR